MDTWKVSLSLTSPAARLLMTDREGNERLKARMPIHPGHPRALTTLCEGLALWVGSPLRVALFAGSRLERADAFSHFGPELWPTESALVHFDLQLPRARRRRRTLAGIGDFRQLRHLHGRS